VAVDHAPWVVKNRWTRLVRPSPVGRPGVRIQVDLTALSQSQGPDHVAQRA